MSLVMKGWLRSLRWSAGWSWRRLPARTRRRMPWSRSVSRALSRRAGEAVSRTRQPVASVVIGSPPASASVGRSGAARPPRRAARRARPGRARRSTCVDRREIAHLEHVDDALELREDLAEVPVVPADRDRHARPTGLVRGADRQRLDVEAARAQQSGDAVQCPGAIDDECADDVASLDGIGLAGGDRRGPWRADGHSAPPSTMSESPLPGSIIG